VPTAVVPGDERRGAETHVESRCKDLVRRRASRLHASPLPTKSPNSSASWRSLTTLCRTIIAVSSRWGL
jgi:hypothetical protein